MLNVPPGKIRGNFAFYIGWLVVRGWGGVQHAIDCKTVRFYSRRYVVPTKSWVIAEMKVDTGGGGGGGSYEVARERIHALRASRVRVLSFLFSFFFLFFFAIHDFLHEFLDRKTTVLQSKRAILHCRTFSFSKTAVLAFVDE